MSTLYALMIVTITGVIEAPNYFKSMDECKEVSKTIQFQSYCVEKRVRSAEEELSYAVAIFKKMHKELMAP